MQQIKRINHQIITRRQSLPWPYAHIYALICAMNCATNDVSRTRALFAKRLVVYSRVVDLSFLKRNLSSPKLLIGLSKVSNVSFYNYTLKINYLDLKFFTFLVNKQFISLQLLLTLI